MVVKGIPALKRSVHRLFVGFELTGRDPLDCGIKRSRHLQCKQATITDLLLIVPPTGKHPGGEIRL